MSSRDDERESIEFDALLADWPTFDAELISQCEAEKDVRPMLFEWYKFIGLKCVKLSCVDFSSGPIREIPKVHRGIFIGLLNRCARLMASNLQMSETGGRGETTQIIDRCIAESAVKIRWLCLKDSEESFVRYIANGIKKDFQLQDAIWANVTDRRGDGIVIEKRMLKSIALTLEKSGLTEMQVIEAKELPDLATMFRDLGLDDYLYLAIQRLGSHAVHGTWTALVAQYLDRDESGEFHPQDFGVATRGIQYVVVCLLVVGAMADYLHYILDDASHLDGFFKQVEAIQKELLRLDRVANGTDFDPEQL